MNKYRKEIFILILQLFMFYVFPLFAGPTDAIGMVFIIWLSTIVLGMMFSILSDKKSKYFYPMLISLLFIPSVYIYYNDSALVHSIWYLISSYFGVFLGIIICLIKSKLNL